MQFALGFVTVLALLMTIAMGVITWRLIRAERRRSAARLAALATALKQQSFDDPTPETAGIQPYEIPRNPEPQTELFGARGGLTDDGASRFAKIAGTGLVMAVLVSIVAIALTVPPLGDGSGEPTNAGSLVELMALTHTQQGGRLAIFGTVRNPVGRPDQERLSVLATAFDEDGNIIASGRAPVAIERLPSGTESGFSVSLDTAHARRFRIRFVIDDATVPHLDRRAATPPEPEGQGDA
jgi:hypothetical protein